MPTSLRIPAPLAERLDKLARQTGRTKTFYIMEAIAEHISDLEDFYLAERRMRNRNRVDDVPLSAAMEFYKNDLEN
jgi:RHH-type rel operon transcriptional repressor/antitoxin RelB